MAEPLKNHFGPDVPPRIADMIVAVHPEFDAAAFVRDSLDGFEPLELLDRGRHIAAALAIHLPPDPVEGMRILVASMGPEIEDPDEPQGMAPFLYHPHTIYVATVGLDHPEASLAAQKEITKRFTAESSIRPFIEHHEATTMARLRDWATDPNVHVRRLVSEGTRPRLPWAGRLRQFQADPTPVLELLELLKDDPEEYVRRSVANNLNDIAKDHPAVVVDVARRWWPEGDRNRRRLIRHALRTLIKQGDPDALKVLGYGSDAPIEVADVAIDPETVRIGERVRVSVEIHNPTDEPVPVLVDLRVHFVKANGSASPKVFKGAEHEVAPGESVTVSKTISVRQHTTRTHHPGVHAVDVIVNGAPRPIGRFRLDA